MTVSGASFRRFVILMVLWSGFLSVRFCMKPFAAPGEESALQAEETGTGSGQTGTTVEPAGTQTSQPGGSVQTPQTEAGTQAAPAAQMEELPKTPLEQAVTQKKTGLVLSEGERYYLKKGKLLKKAWKKVKGKKYYFSADGKAVKNRSRKIRGVYWIFDKNGVLSTGKGPHVLRLKISASDIRRYLVQKDGSAAAKGWQTVKNRKYYVYKNGLTAAGIVKAEGHYYYFRKNGALGTGTANRIVTVNGKDYLVTKTGETGSGWCEIGEKYCFCEADGSLLKNTVKDKIKINKKGLAKTRPMTPLERRADEIVRSITTSGMSQSQKIAACWNYITSRSRFTYRAEYDPNAYTQSEFRRLALTMLNINGGNCYGFAASFAALTKAAGCDSYVIYGLCPGTRDQRPDGLTRHSWTYISGHGYFDPEGQFAGFAYIYGSGSCPWIPHGRVAI